MSDCGCEKARESIEDLLRGELCAEESAPIREHLDSCADCRDEEQVCQRLTEAVRRACAEQAPASLHEAIRAGFARLHE